MRSLDIRDEFSHAEIVVILKAALLAMNDLNTHPEICWRWTAGKESDPSKWAARKQQTLDEVEALDQKIDMYLQRFATEAELDYPIAPREFVPADKIADLWEEQLRASKTPMTPRQALIEGMYCATRRSMLSFKRMLENWEKEGKLINWRTHDAKIEIREKLKRRKK